MSQGTGVKVHFRPSTLKSISVNVLIALMESGNKVD